MDGDKEPLITLDDLTEELQVSRDTVYRWNYNGTGPTRIRVGRHVRYRRADVDKWIAARTIEGGAA